jgi:hypothetical protein
VSFNELLVAGAFSAANQVLLPHNLIARRVGLAAGQAGIAQVWDLLTSRSARLFLDSQFAIEIRRTQPQTKHHLLYNSLFRELKGSAERSFHIFLC